MNLSLRTVTVPAVDVEFLASAKGLITKGVTLDATMVRTGQYTANRKLLKAGTVLAKITASGLYAPCKKSTVAANAAANATAVQLTDASFFQVGDSVIIGTEAAKTVTAIDYTTNTITVTALAAVQNAGVAVKIGNGLETAECILMQSTDLTDGNSAVATATQAVVLKARIPGFNTLIQVDLARVEFR